MFLTIAHAAWAWAAAIIVVAGVAVIWHTRRRRHTRSPRWWAAGILLPLFAATALALALAAPSLAVGPGVPLVILLDLSASARDCPWQDPAWVRALALRRLGPTRSLTIVAFSNTTRTLLENVLPNDPHQWPQTWAQVDPLPAAPAAQTDLRAALAWRTPRELSGTAPLAPRWIITDGLIDRAALAAALPSIDAPLAWTILPPAASLPPGGLDAAVRDLIVRPLASTPNTQTVELFTQIRLYGTAPPPLLPPLPQDAEAPLETLVTITRDGLPLTRQTLTFHASPTTAPPPPRNAAPSTTDAPVNASRWITLRDTFPAGPAPHRYDVRVQLLPPRPGATPPQAGDPWPENDRASILWAPPSVRRTLVIGRPPNLCPIPGVFLPIDQFFGDEATLAAEGWQTIVLYDVPAGTEATPPATIADPRHAATAASAPSPAAPPTGLLSPTAARALDHFVRDTGGGLILMGAAHAFGPGSYGDPATDNPAADLLEVLSPVWSRPHQSDTAPLHLIFLLDASGSMNDAVILPHGAGAQRKFRIAARALEQAAALLAPQDRITVIPFSDHAQPILDGSVSDIASAIAPALDRLQPAGATVPDTALDALARTLQSDSPAPPASPPPDSRAVPAASRLEIRQRIILLTDGDIPSLTLNQWTSVLAPTTIHTPNPRLTIIAPAPALADAASPLQRLAAALPETTWLVTPDAAAWPLQLQRAVNKEVRGGLHTDPLLWRMTPFATDIFFPSPTPAVTPATIPPPVTPAATATFARTSLWTRVWLKPESNLLVTGTPASSGAITDTDQPFPLVARARRGLGQVTAIAMADDAPPSPAYRALLDAVVNDVAATPGDRRFSVSAHPVPGEAPWLLTVDGADAHGFLNAQTLHARLLQSTPANVPPPHGQRCLRSPDPPPPNRPRPLRSPPPRRRAFHRHHHPRHPPPNSPHPPQSPDEQLIARLTTPAIETTEWPASIDSPMQPGTPLLSSSPSAAPGQFLPASPTDNTLWQPPSTPLTIPLAPTLYIFATLATLLALCLR